MSLGISHIDLEILDHIEFMASIITNLSSFKTMGSLVVINFRIPVGLVDLQNLWQSLPSIITNSSFLKTIGNLTIINFRIP